MIKLGSKRQNMRIVADQRGCPTYAADLAAAILRIIEQYREKKDLPWGTYHFCGEGSTTWHAFAERIFTEAKRYESLTAKEVAPVTTEEYPTPARRPANSVLDCSKIRCTLGIRLRPWRSALEEMVERLYNAKSLRPKAWGIDSIIELIFGNDLRNFQGNFSTFSENKEEKKHPINPVNHVYNYLILIRIQTIPKILCLGLQLLATDADRHRLCPQITQII